MSNINKAYSVDNGLIVDENDGGPFYTGGTASPVGLDLPTQSLYVRPTSAGVEIWRKYDTGVNDWRQLSAQDIPFDNTGIKFHATNAYDAIKEVQENQVNSIQILTSTLNGNHQIAEDDAYIHDVQGTATGYSVTLPNAQNVFLGKRLEVSNNSTQTVIVKDFQGNTIATLASGDLAVFTLETQATTAGVWILGISAQSATGIISEVVSSSTTFNTSSTTDTIITGFTVTPQAGRYSFYFSADTTVTGNNAIFQAVAYVGGSAIETTRRSVQGVGSNFRSQITAIGEITVNGSQAVDIRVNISASSVAVNQRSLVLVRLGS